MRKFSAFSFLQANSEDPDFLKGSTIHIYEDEDDLDQCLYYLKTLSNILQWSTDSMWTALANNAISTDPKYPSLYRISKSSFVMREVPP